MISVENDPSAIPMQKPRPNILILLCDQLRRQALSCYGDPNIRTPALDRLAARGARFTQAYSSYPICVPYRFTLMTGEYAHTRGVPAINWRMSPAERTLADEFNAAGYDTLYIGKWHLHGGCGPADLKRPVPREHQGRWRKWFGFELRNRHFDTVVFEDDDPTPIPLHQYQTDGLYEIAAREIGKRSANDPPFACVLSVEPPHPPWEAPPELEAKWLAREIELPPNFLVAGEYDERARGWARRLTGHDHEETLRHRKIYYAMLENIDANVGRLMGLLERKGLLENTLVVFTSDHGEMNGSHALEQKHYPYEDSVGIPLLISGPGISAGQVIADPVVVEDFFPTFLGLTGLPVRAELPGQDLTPLLTRKMDKLDRPGVMLELVAEHRDGACFFGKPWRAFVSGHDKYTLLHQDGGLIPWQFFDLEKDPYEMQNRLADPACEARIRHCHAALIERMQATGDDEAVAPAWGFPALNPWTA